MAILEIKNLWKNFGGMSALAEFDLNINESEIIGIIGPNGAGKTTLFNVISGFHPVTSGSIKFKGEEITGLRPDQIAKKGISRSFQLSSLFPQSTVFENVYMAFHMHHEVSPWKAFLPLRSVIREERMIKEKVMEILDFTGLKSQKSKVAETLSSGWQKALGISIPLATNPKLLLLDEPATTLSQDRVEMIMNLVKRVRNKGTTIAIIEHNMKAIMDYCDRIIVIAYGRKIAEGKAEEIKENTDVIEAYLGVMGDAA